MGKAETEVKCCPRCKRAVGARDYVNTLVGSILPKLRCRCGYRGLPIEMSYADYEKWRASE